MQKIGEWVLWPKTKNIIYAWAQKCFRNELEPFEGVSATAG
jgi:hypothetical protein